MLHRDLSGVLDLVNTESIELSDGRCRHGTGASDLRLAAALCSGDAGICTNHIADKACDRERIQDLLLRKTSVLVHIIEDRRQNSAAAAGRRGNYDIFSCVFLAGRIGVGRDDSVHSHIRALVVAALLVQELRFSCQTQTAGEYTFGFKTALN